MGRLQRCLLVVGIGVGIWALGGRLGGIACGADSAPTLAADAYPGARLQAVDVDTDGDEDDCVVLGLLFGTPAPPGQVVEWYVRHYQAQGRVVKVDVHDGGAPCPPSPRSTGRPGGRWRYDVREADYPGHDLYFIKPDRSQSGAATRRRLVLVRRTPATWLDPIVTFSPERCPLTAVGAEDAFPAGLTMETKVRVDGWFRSPPNNRDERGSAVDRARLTAVWRANRSELIAREKALEKRLQPPGAWLEDARITGGGGLGYVMVHLTFLSPQAPSAVYAYFRRTLEPIARIKVQSATALGEREMTALRIIVNQDGRLVSTLSIAQVGAHAPGLGHETQEPTTPLPLSRITWRFQRPAPWLVRAAFLPGS
jgi:hypothetical protein